jgi:hypothetical protein
VVAQPYPSLLLKDYRTACGTKARAQARRSAIVRGQIRYRRIGDQRKVKTIAFGVGDLVTKKNNKSLQTVLEKSANRVKMTR